MKLLRWAMSLRTLMLTVLVLGVFFGTLARWRESKRRQLAMEALSSEQYLTTVAIDEEVWADVSSVLASLPGEGRKFNRGIYGGVPPNEGAWTVRRRLVHGNEDHPTILIDYEIRSSIESGSLKPIRISDRGGELNARLIEKFVTRYRKERWAFEFVPVIPQSTRPQ